MLETHKLRGHVILADFRTDIPECLAAMTCLVFPSFKIEGTPQVLLQALAMVKPVIATRVGGIPNLIVDRETGRLVEPQNAAGLGEVVGWVVDHLPEARRMAERGRAVIVQDFALDRTIERTTTVYQELL